MGPTRLPDAAGEETQQREHEYHDQDDPENAHLRRFPPFRQENDPQRLTVTGASSRSRAGSTPHRSASAVYSSRARDSRWGEGARTARIITFLAVCSAETNSITSAR